VSVSIGIMSLMIDVCFKKECLNVFFSNQRTKGKYSRYEILLTCKFKIAKIILFFPDHNGSKKMGYRYS